VLVYWAYVQLRIPLPESSFSRYAKVALLHAACVLTILVNPFAYRAAVTARIAELVPDAAFAAEYRYHADRNFWLCGVDPEEGAAQRPRIDATLQSWGLAPLALDFELGWYSCDGLAPATIIRPPLSTLRDRMESVRAAKALRDRDPGYPSFLSLLPGFVLLSVLVGAALVPALIPASVWKRRLVPERAALPKLLDLPIPRWARRLDRHLVEERPLLWSLRLHTFAYRLLVYGLPALAVGLIVYEALDAGPGIADGAILVAWLAYPAALLAWWVGQWRLELREPRLRGNRTALFAYYLFAAVLAAPLGAVAALAGSTGALVFVLSALLGGGFAAGSVYVAKYIGGAAAAAIGGGAFAFTLYNSVLGSGAIPIVLWLIVAGFAIAHARSAAAPTRFRAIIAALHITLLPAAWGIVVLLVADNLDDHWFYLLPLVPVALLLLVYAATPAMHTFIRLRYQPQAA
jgi:hypothetical protein